jgi:hypothetical protein
LWRDGRLLSFDETRAIDEVSRSKWSPENQERALRQDADRLASGIPLASELHELEESAPGWKPPWRPRGGDEAA